MDGDAEWTAFAQVCASIGALLPLLPRCAPVVSMCARDACVLHIIVLDPQPRALHVARIIVAATWQSITILPGTASSLMQHEALTTRLANILREYPAGVGVLKEFIQVALHSCPTAPRLPCVAATRLPVVAQPRYPYRPYRHDCCVVKTEGWHSFFSGLTVGEAECRRRWSTKARDWL